jgi:hypothetical protein
VSSECSTTIASSSTVRRGGRQPTWAASCPNSSASRSAKRIRQTPLSDGAVPYLEAQAARVLYEHRDTMRPVLEIGGVEFALNEIRLWTFTGGRIDGTPQGTSRSGNCTRLDLSTAVDRLTRPRIVLGF